MFDTFAGALHLVEETVGQMNAEGCSCSSAHQAE